MSLILKNLKTEREGKDMTRETLASMAMVTTETIRRAECGKSVTHSTASRIAKALKVAVSKIQEAV